MKKDETKIEQKCPRCNDTGWLSLQEDGYSAVKRCNCFYSRIPDQLIKEARIPKRYENCDIENFYDFNDKDHPEQIKFLRQAKKISSDFVLTYPNNEAGLLLIGPCGAGKTHLAVGIIKELIKRKSVPCIFYDFRELLKEIQNSYNQQSQTTEFEILQPILEKKVVVLDELGASKITNWIQDTLSYIINQRYNDKKTTIFTSNFLDEPINEKDETLGIRIGTRLRSRLYEMCRVVEINVGDYRKRMQHDRMMAIERHKKVLSQK